MYVQVHSAPVLEITIFAAACRFLNQTLNEILSCTVQISRVKAFAMTIKNATSLEHSAAAFGARVDVCVLNSLLTLGLSGDRRAR